MTLSSPSLKIMLPWRIGNLVGWLVSNVSHMAFTISLHHHRHVHRRSLQWWFMHN